MNETRSPHDHHLSHWVVGTFTFHFSEGSVVTQRMHLDEARRVEAMLSGTRESDALEWHALVWFHFDPERVVFGSFVVAEDGGWSMTPGDRDAVTKAGHPHGVLRSLLDCWAERRNSEPEYSLHALSLLNQAAVDGLDRKKWTQLTLAMQGKDGARRIADTIRGYQKSGPEQPTADDLAEPEQAPATAASGAPEAAEPEGPAGPDARDEPADPSIDQDAQDLRVLDEPAVDLDSAIAALGHIEHMATRCVSRPSPASMSLPRTQ